MDTNGKSKQQAVMSSDPSQGFALQHPELGLIFLSSSPVFRSRVFSSGLDSTPKGLLT